MVEFGTRGHSARRRVAIAMSTVGAMMLMLVPPAGADQFVEFAFEDAVGDVTLAPDVHTVEGNWSSAGPLVIDIGFSNVTDVFGEFQSVTMGFDTDFDSQLEFLLLSTGFGGTRICEREPDGDPNSFTCVFQSDRVIGELRGGVLHIEFFDTDLLSDDFQFFVSTSSESPEREFDFAGYWAVALIDETPPEIRVAIDPITLWPTQPEGNTLVYGSFVRADDLIDPDPELVCDPPSGSLLPIGETVVTCTATDDAGNSATRSFTVIVLSPLQILTSLEETVATSDAPAATGLARLLERAAAHLESGRSKPACSVLGAFVTAASAMGDNEATGVPVWWASNAGYVSERILECDG